MIKTIDEAIKHCEEKYYELKNSCIECAEDHKKLADWLIDYKRLKAKEEAENELFSHIKEILDINDDEALSDKAVMNILNDKELTEETQKEINSILEKRNQNNNRWNMVKETQKKIENNSIDKKYIEEIKECIYKNR